MHGNMAEHVFGQKKKTIFLTIFIIFTNFKEQLLSCMYGSSRIASLILHNMYQSKTFSIAFVFCSNKTMLGIILSMNELDFDLKRLYVEPKLICTIRKSSGTQACGREMLYKFNSNIEGVKAIFVEII